MCGHEKVQFGCTHTKCALCTCGFTPLLYQVADLQLRAASCKNFFLTMWTCDVDIHMTLLQPVPNPYFQTWKFGSIFNQSRAYEE